MKSFGDYFKQKRLKMGLTLRQFCNAKDLDPAYVSRIENNLKPAPRKKTTLKSLAKALNIKKDSIEWTEFFELASISRNEIPEYIKEEFPEIQRLLPAFFRSVKKKKVTRKDIKQLLKVIKGGKDESKD